MDNQYQAYLLRLQRSPERTHWRATLENVHTGEVQHFADASAMLLYLHQSASHAASK